MEEPSRKRILWLEVGAVLCLGVILRLWSGVVDFAYGYRPISRGYWVTDIGSMLQSVSLIAPLVFILWVSGDGLQRFGIRKIPWWRVLSVAFLGFFSLILIRLVFGILWQGMSPVSYYSIIGYSPTWSWHTPSAINPAIRILAFLPAAFGEELLFRGYLITRLRDLLGSTWVALVASSLLFGLGHLYEGLPMAIYTFFSGTLYAACFLGTRSLAPGTIAHFSINTLAIFLRTM